MPQTKNTKKTPAKTTKTTKKTEEPPKKTKKQAEADPPEVENTKTFGKRQFFELSLFAASLFLFALAFIHGSGDSPWDKLRAVWFGLFGFTAFLTPALLMVFAVAMSRERISGKIILRLINCAVLIVLIGSFIHIMVSEPPIDYLNGIKDVLYAGKAAGGGAFGAALGGALLLIGKTKAPAMIITLILMFLSAALLTGATLVKIFDTAEKPVKKIKDKTGEIKTRKAEKRDLAEARELKKKADAFNIPLGPGATTDAPLEDYIKVDGSRRPTISDILPKTVPDTDMEVVDISESEKTEFDEIFKRQSKKKKGKPDGAEPEIVKTEYQSEKPEKEDKKKPPEGDFKTDNIGGSVFGYRLPPLDCLNAPLLTTQFTQSRDELVTNGEKLISALKSFNVEAAISEIVPGPAVTRYELTPAPGVKISKFTSLSDDLALHLAAPAGVRIEAPIPDKAAIAVEIPNRRRATVTFREMVENSIFKKSENKLLVAVGKDITGAPVYCNIQAMPHLLIAGATGMGKSVCLNSIITSILFSARPDEVKMILIDPKQVEFTPFIGIPHLLVPVVTDAKKAAGALGWAVKEMEDRYKSLNTAGVRNITDYNKKCEKSLKMAENGESEEIPLEKMHFIVIVIDEFSDLMSVASQEVQESIQRLAQKSRAAGIHLVVATQRPSVDVITGTIKVNLPSRMALAVQSQVDSRTILDTGGAEKLLGKGDMLYAPITLSKPIRVQGCYISDPEIEKVVEFVKAQESTEYNSEVLEEIERQAAMEKKKGLQDMADASG
ncbi:MAG: FtsK/SpoIIIE domain-containing protein, partial [Oscillospiraceae bacterium]|nr:FtsK/SpoIIIE domain-containing protein [Oscillospiraceae bacterium]